MLASKTLYWQSGVQGCADGTVCCVGCSDSGPARSGLGDFGGGESPNFDPLFDPFFGSSPKVVRFCPKKLQNVTFDPVLPKFSSRG